MPAPTAAGEAASPHLTAADGSGDACCVCWETTAAMVSLACCQGAICKGCVQGWVANRTMWPGSAASRREMCPRCAGELRGTEVLAVTAAAKADRAACNSGASESLVGDFGFVGIRQRLPTLAMCDVASILWKAVWTCGEKLNRPHGSTSHLTALDRCCLGIAESHGQYCRMPAVWG